MTHDFRYADPIAKDLIIKARAGEISLLPERYIDLERIVSRKEGDPLITERLLIYHEVTGRFLINPVKVIRWLIFKTGVMLDNEFPVKLPFAVKLVMTNGGKEVPCLFIPTNKVNGKYTLFSCIFIDEVDLNRLFVESPKYRLEVLAWKM